jgi:glycosyltransferase involved in cell wall biosynthesis
MKKVSCLIPFYNEGKQLLEVLSVVRQIPEIAQIVCVDDGSRSKRLSRTIQVRFPEVEVVTLPCNNGKSAAVECGLPFCTGEIILLMDADLVGVNRRELQNAIRMMQEDTPLGMIILRRMKAAWFVKIIRGDILLSGERLLRKSDLEEILASVVNGYQLEAAINNYMKSQRKKVIWMPHSARNTYKVAKSGFVKGMIREARMYASIFSYIGWNTFISHLFTFCNKKGEPRRREIKASGKI